MDNAGNPYEGGCFDSSFVQVSGPDDQLKCANKKGDYDYTVDGTSARKSTSSVPSAFKLIEKLSNCYDSRPPCGFHDRVWHEPYSGVRVSVRKSLQ